MAESVTVRCPACRREHHYTAPSFPCACGSPVTPALDLRAALEPVTHHTWDEDWVMVRCAACGREDEWPRPELGCSCGTVLRVPVTEPPAPRGHARPTEPDTDTAPATRTEADAAQDPVSGQEPPTPRADSGTDPEVRAAEGTDDGSGARRADAGADHPDSTPGTAPDSAPATGPGTPAPRIPLPREASAPRPAFQPVTIRTARDAVTVAALYLRWLGYQDIRRADQRPPSGIGLAARGVLAQVEPALSPASLRDVECLWLTAMTESVGCVYFSLAGYAEDARTRADSLGIPLFVLDLTGTPRPVNSLADELIAAGA
ncbi:hypothetical protein FE633_23950 [Streptomyces montanus]|uniref:Restriction endonuclease type IV Mrr domain-containing protein n=1 Tax=Streptomyces montanus TaxID=2580423 RepID=A0A5R9FJ04_9ACTN|nr:hypothetical protein [Streptomyces montanus]TLS43842.1 hypothetical protein FE633_23950 [Streptomyces montanus]